MRKELIRVLLTLAALLVLAASLPAQVIEEEDLDEPALGVGEPRSEEEFAALFAAAEAQLFTQQDPVGARSSFDRLLQHFESRRVGGELSETGRRLMVRSLAYRARIHFAYSDLAAVDADLGRMLELEAATELDAATVEPEILERFTRLRAQRVGALEITVDPPDLVLKIDGREIALKRAAGADAGPAPIAGPGASPAAPPRAEGEEPAPPPATVVALLAGIRLLEAERPGYAPFVTEVEVKAGRETPLPVVLERSSAVLYVHTRPPGAEVLLDGLVRGMTAGTAAPGSLPTGGRYRPSEFSDRLEVTGVEPGRRIFEVRMPGYRPYRSELLVEALDDYRIPPVVLQSESGAVVLRSFPAGASIRIDGEPVRGDDPGGPSPRITLAPGEHHLEVTAGPTRMFSTRVTVADAQTVEITVQLRPGLAFLGVLGGDAGRAADLAQSLRLALRESGRWSLLDYGGAGPALLERAGMTATSARRAAADTAAIDWRAVQRAADSGAPGLIYLAAVLSDDLVATHADVWIWAAAPGPARPERARLTLGRQEEARQLAARFSPTFELRRPWLGGLVVTSAAAPHPLVADLTPEGPLMAAGVSVGDQIVALAGVPVFSGADVEKRLLAAETGETIDVAVQTADGTRSVRVTLGSSPRIYSEPIPGAPEAIAFTELGRQAEEAPAATAWVLRLNQALVLLRAGDYEGAVRILRDLRAPQNPRGVGQGTVDYYMGLALAAAGPDYHDLAVAALRRAAAAQGARLGHHDGPWVAPRAQARLLALGSGS